MLFSGITLPSLWKRLEIRPGFSLKLDEAARAWIWEGVIRNHPEIALLELVEPRIPLVLRDRFSCVDPDTGIVLESVCILPLVSYEDVYFALWDYYDFATSLANGGYVFGSIGLSVYKQHYSNNYEWISMKFYRGIWGSKRKNWLNFGGGLCVLR